MKLLMYLFYIIEAYKAIFPYNVLLVTKLYFTSLISESQSQSHILE